jgi:hypothetical protein
MHGLRARPARRPAIVSSKSAETPVARGVQGMRAAARLRAPRGWGTQGPCSEGARGARACDRQRGAARRGARLEHLVRLVEHQDANRLHAEHALGEPVLQLAVRADNDLVDDARLPARGARTRRLRRAPHKAAAVRAGLPAALAEPALHSPSLVKDCGEDKLRA